MLTENLWRHIDYSWRRPYSRKSTAGFGFSDGTRLAMCTFICILNFDETSQSTAELFLLPVCGNGRPEIYFCMAFCIGVPTFIQYRSTHAVLWHYIDFQDGGEIHLWLRCWWRHSFKNIQISPHSNFRWDISNRGWVIIAFVLWKTNVHHIEILFPVSILIYAS